ncbi:glycoside hydrolase family 27 protein [Cellulomonas fengjieae]|uniref:Alpha-galactosidase n=1 Tax=Cellulomonas fengjieae TaxID=2819978 RepID=A0ABS3SJS0_9CELL|nr:glycoside hydrolase family 27 protein [Cellulomonas fengjieae]MBO3085993.1 glycoside hydrolase family 27 protein [Cellulomonas fengjieae]QVI65937.1 glycoside hydrolase family 27 protein [Cellulomonas fengjieae]
MATTPSPRPPMGWNSWDSYGTSVTEQEVLANAEFMAEHLLPFGWDTVVVDIDWADPTARAHGYNADAPLELDEHGRLLPDPGRFPSAAGGAGFGPLAAKVHALGLRFGIHTMRGIPRGAVERDTPILGTDATASQVADPTNVCEWNPDMVGLDHTQPAAQAYYDSTLALYAQWGVDFLKTDDMLWPYQAADIEAYARAIARTGRPIELSLSPGRDLSLTRLDHLREHATMWRICDDLWDRWEDVEANFARFARWAPFAGEHGWPDGDMLPLGRIGIRAERGEPRDDLLTPAERVTLLTLWVVARSPLMVGGDLPTSDPATVALLQNRDVLAVHATSTGNREVFREGGLVLWTAQGPDGVRYVAAFNLDAEPRHVAVDARDVGLPVSADGVDGEVVELWSGEPVRTSAVAVQSDDARGVAPGSAALHLSIEPHGALLLRCSPAA